MSDRPALELRSGDDAPRLAVASDQGQRAVSYDEGSNVLGNEIHLVDYVKVLYKRRWVALTAFTIVVLSVALYTFTATPIYEARVQVLIEKENANVVTFKEAFE